MRYRIILPPTARSHLRSLTARQEAIVLDAIAQQLEHEPTRQTRNRKRLRPNPLANWELRVGNLRVYYRVATDPEPEVVVVAIAVKVGNRAWVGGEELKL